MRAAGYVFLIFFLIFSKEWALASPIGAVTASQGQTEIIRPGQSGLPADAGMSVHTGDMAKTGSGSKLEIRFDDGSIIRIGENSQAQLSEYLFQNDRIAAKIFLHAGKIRTIVKKAARLFGLKEENRFEVHTDTAVIGARGTDFITLREGKRTRATFISGEGYCYPLGNPEAVEKVSSGHSVTVSQTGERPQVHPATASEMQQDIKDTDTLTDTDFIHYSDPGPDDTRTASPY